MKTKVQSTPGSSRREALRPLLFGLCLLSSVFWFVPSALAEFPVPGFTYYGEARNAYGWPYTRADEAQVIVRLDGRECGRTTVDERLGPGINYRVEVPLDDGRGGLYASFAARTNAQPAFVVRVGSQEFVVMDPTNSPPIGVPGGRLRLNFFRDTDTDGDGLPDTWEQMILFAYGFTNISQVLPDDDADGDGVSNRDEFIAGTDPTWDVDRLAMEHIVFLPTVHRFGVGFYSVRAKSYQLMGASSLPQWQELDFAVNNSQTNGAVQRFWRGDGYYSWLFADTLTNSHRMFRLKAQ